MTLETIGKYRILDELGAGGMGTVFKAEHVQLGRTVALKVIKERYAGQEAHLERFKREAAVCASLRHPNIIHMYDYGEENGVIFYAMEMLEADTLDDYIEKYDGKVPLKKIMPIAEAMCSAFSYIHERGLIHRDIKPANIMIAKDGHVTIMDFGLVKALQQTQLTQAGKAIGTPRYMSPEMLRAEEVDKRSDIFQLGLVLYEAATGEMPFKGNDIYVLARNILTSDPKKPSKLVRNLGRNFDALILNCLEKDLDLRYQTAEEVQADVNRVNKKIPVKLRRQTMSQPELTDTMVQSTPSTDGAEPLALSTSLSRIGLSTLSNPVQLIKETLNLRQILALIILVIAIPLGLFLLFSGEDIVYMSHSVQVLPGIDAARITWRSEHPYNTVIALKEADLPPSSFENIEGEEKGNKHRVILSNLKRGVRYEFQVVYPDGRQSLSHYIEPLLADRIQISRSSVTWPELNKICGEWETNIPCKSRLTYRLRGQSKEELLAKKYVTNHRTIWDKVQYDEILSNVVIHFQSIKNKEMIALGDLHGPQKPINMLMNSLSDFRPQKLLTKVATEIRNLGRKQKGKRAEERLQLELKHEPSWKKFKKLRPLLKPLFKSNGVSTKAVKFPLYMALRKLDMLDGLLDFYKLPPVTGAAKEFEPFLRLRHSKEEPSGTFLELLAYDEQGSSFTPVNMNKKSFGGIAAGVLKVYQKHQEMKTKDRIEFTQDLTDFLPSCSENPRFIIRARNFRPEFFFRLTINDIYFLDFRNTAQTAPPTMWLSIQSNPPLPDTPGYNKAVNFTSLRIPKSILKTGENKLSLELQILPGTNTVHFVQMRSLRLYRR